MSGIGAISTVAPSTVVVAVELAPRSKSVGPPVDPSLPGLNPHALARGSTKMSRTTVIKQIISIIPSPPWALRRVFVSRDTLPMRLPHPEVDLLPMEAHAVAGGPSC